MGKWGWEDKRCGWHHGQIRWIILLCSLGGGGETQYKNLIEMEGKEKKKENAVAIFRVWFHPKMSQEMSLWTELFTYGYHEEGLRVGSAGMVPLMSSSTPPGN